MDVGPEESEEELLECGSDFFRRSFRFFFFQRFRVIRTRSPKVAHVQSRSGSDILASEMQRDPAFALAVGSLERCLRVRERVGSSLILGRLGKPPGSVSHSHDIEVVRRSGAVGGTAILPISAIQGSFCAVGEARQSSVRLRTTVDWWVVWMATFARRLAGVVTLEPRLRLRLQLRVRESMGCLCCRLHCQRSECRCSQGDCR